MDGMSRLLALCVLLLTSAAPAWAEDPPAPAPEPAPEAQPAAPAPDAGESKPFDLQVYLAHVRTLVSENMTPPRRTATDHGLYDAWAAILRPRAARIRARVSRLMEPGRWQLDPGDGRAAHVKPEVWGSTIAELGSLYVELGGALQQYQQAKVTITQVRPDNTQAPPTGPVPGEVALGTFEAELLARARAGEVVLPDEVAAYWHLLGRVQAALALREEQLRTYLQRQAEVQGELENLVSSIQSGLLERQQSLSLQMLTVRALTAALQAREEQRLADHVGALPAGDDRKAADALLESLRGSRLAAEEHAQPPVSEYGVVLRRWLKAQQDLSVLLRKAAAAAPKPS
jgi:hypothetical protein